MRHGKKRHLLARPADQRKALLRTLATSFVIANGEIITTLGRAKALKPVLDKLITLGKQGDVHSMRMATRVLYNQPTGEVYTTDSGKAIAQTVLRKLFREIAPKFAERQGGYTRVLKLPPRRGDASPMALIQLSE